MQYACTHIHRSHRQVGELMWAVVGFEPTRQKEAGAGRSVRRKSKKTSSRSLPFRTTEMFQMLIEHSQAIINFRCGRAIHSVAEHFRFEGGLRLFLTQSPIPKQKARQKGQRSQYVPERRIVIHPTFQNCVVQNIETRIQEKADAQRPNSRRKPNFLIMANK